MKLINANPKPDPCHRPFFASSLADDFRVVVWLPNRDSVDMLPSDIFPNFGKHDFRVFGMGMIVGYENIH